MALRAPELVGDFAADDFALVSNSGKGWQALLQLEILRDALTGILTVLFLAERALPGGLILLAALDCPEAPAPEESSPEGAVEAGP